MEDNLSRRDLNETDLEKDKKDKTFKPIFPILFIITLITTTISGAEWMYGKPLLYFEPGLTLSETLSGVYFSIPFLGILTIHEFGHYFAARYYNIKVTLPYYIPLWLGFVFMPFTIGTMGAFIRIKEPIKSRKEYFDVGIAGPLAGFVAALVVLYIGFTHLPPADYIYQIHPEYVQYGSEYADYVYNEPGSFYLGKNLTYQFFEEYVATDQSLVPNPFEIIHYPLLFAGFLALFFTAINLLPIGQMDGGHVLFGLFGWKKHRIISLSLFIGFLYYSGLGLVTPFDSTDTLLYAVPMYIAFLFFTLLRLRMSLRTKFTIAVSIFAAQFVTTFFFPGIHGWLGWLLWGFIIGRFLGIYHPPALINEPLSMERRILGWIALMVFIISFSPMPFVLT
jgi:membrane-associated protease RseP (regulator of RpoE activity)